MLESTKIYKEMSLGVAPFTKSKNRVQHTKKNPIYKFFCKIKQYKYNFNDKNASDNMYT